MDSPAPKRFGRYEITGDLGRGAMGIVLKARDPQIERTVALKTVPLNGQQRDEEEEFRRRFQNEAQAAGRLHHPGIVSIFDVGEDPETKDPYIVLEYVAGDALNRLLAREKKLPLARALQIAAEIAEALDYAHGQGVIHRDIKPGNILMTQDGHPKIADFGIAKLNLSHMTVPGKVLGTPAYMAPEQLAGQKADGRADLFSLGVILYAMVVGHSPFHGENATTVCYQVANAQPIPASAVDVNLPRELDAIISRAMAKDPAKRYQRGNQFADALHELQAQCCPDVAVPKSPTRKTLSSPVVLPGRPAVGSAYALKLVRAAILNAPTKDLILGFATIILLVIVGIQSNLLFHTREEAADPAGVALQQVATSPAPVSASSAPAPRKPATVAKNVDRTPKQIVVPLSLVELAVRHQFKDATLSVYMDDKLVLKRALHGGTQKKLVVFNGIRGMESETLKLPAGKHVLRFRAHSADDTVDLSKTLASDFIGGADKTLQVTFDKHNTAMHLDWQ